MGTRMEQEEGERGGGTMKGNDEGEQGRGTRKGSGVVGGGELAKLSKGWV